MRWEYSRAWVWHGRRGWGVSKEGRDYTVDGYLRLMGEDGWELVTAVVAEQYKDGRAAHWLYFKRPKQ